MQARPNQHSTTGVNFIVADAPYTQRTIGFRYAFDQAAQAVQVSGWGLLPALSVVCACGVFAVAVAFTGSRAGADWLPQALFWFGLTLILLPMSIRLLAAEATREERIGIVTVLGLALYLVKVMHSPFGFTFPDELSHYRNAVEVLKNHEFFHENPALAATAYYPGLQTFTTALISLSGLDIFTAGIITVGAARLVLVVSVFLFQEQLSRSSRVAGVATVLYMGNTNFLFWGAQFAYESLALPLAVLVLFVVLRREAIEDNIDRLGYTLIAMLALLAVVVTHHMTSYVLTACLLIISAAYFVYYKGKRTGPLGLALLAMVATLSWLVYVASYTINYLSPVLLGAVRSMIRLIGGEEAARQLFTSPRSAYQAPLWERVFGFGAVLLVLLGQPFGFVQIWRRYRQYPAIIIVVGAAFAYFGMLGLRFTSAGWETSNRSSEFLFLGISFVLAVAIVDFFSTRRIFRGFGHVLLAGCMLVIFVGGVITGWTPRIRLAQPYLIDAGEHQVEPQGVAMAKWTLANLGADNRVAVDASNAKLLAAYGEQLPYTRQRYGVRNMFYSSIIGRTERRLLRRTGIKYVVVDRRLISWNHVLGIYWRVGSDPNQAKEMFETDVYAKFDQQNGVSRIFDSGNIAIYDVGVLRDATPTY